MTATVLHGDCIEQMRGLADASVDSIVTDPPYELGFMGKSWDASGIANSVEMWAEVFRVLKPGGHLLAFSATRTQHRMVCAIEDAGFEIRDQIGWMYGTGFPKSMDVSKQLDLQEKNRWLDVCKAIDNLNHADILGAWKECSNSAKPAELIFQRSAIETGTNTPRSASVPASVRLSISPERSHASAIIAELNSSAALRMTGGKWLSAQSSADASTTALSAHVIIAEHSPESREATRDTTGSSAQCDALAFPDASISLMVKAAEALKIWLGSKPSSRREAITALCAELTDALKLITLSRSETFRSLDTKSQTDFASATTATITEYTAASLISYTVGILRNKAIDKAAGAEREVVGIDPARAARLVNQMGSYETEAGWSAGSRSAAITAPATPEAQQWAGWGTALKPAWEPICVARKPLIGTVAANVLEHGTGALNIDACRVASAAGDEPMTWGGNVAMGFANNSTGQYGGKGAEKASVNTAGRWPANVIHDGSDEVLAAFAAFGESKSGVAGKRGGKNGYEGGWGEYGEQWGGYADSGTPARFFYSAKASKADRAGSKHPTVKPLNLMRYLCKLVTPPGGTVLDPFAGSGTTLQAAIEEGFCAIGIEREAEYHADILRRLELARKAMEKPAPAPKEKKIRVAKPKKAPDPTWPTLFDLMVCEAA
jgi:DNA modification methylase